MTALLPPHALTPLPHYFRLGYRWSGGLIVDNFAGGGGASTGIAQGIGRSPDIAVNHNAEALAMHKENHPETKHFNESVWDIDVREATGGQPVLMGWFSPDCFPAGTMVLTSEGYRAIETLKVGDYVWSHENRWRPVTATMQSAKPVMKIRGYGHPGLEVSGEHPFYIRKGKSEAPEWVKAKDLQTGYYWAAPADFVASTLEAPQVGGRGMVTDENLLWLAGYYVGNGWSRITDTRAELVLTTHKQKLNALQKRVSAWNRPEGVTARCGYNQLAWHSRETKTAGQLSTNHRGLVEWLRDQFGHRAENKKIPGWVLNLSPALKEAFLNGYLEADGYTRDGLVQISTVSRKLAFGLKDLATSMGKSVSTYIRENQRDVIEGRKVNVQPCWAVRWREQVSESHAQTWVEAGHRWAAIKSVEHLEGSVPVYNISVDVAESYVVEGIVTHNCTHFSVAKGGKPVKKAIRGLAWAAKKWAGQSDMAMFFLENVAEFTTWGPLIAKRDKATGRVIRLVPDGKDRKGNEKYLEVVAEPGERVPYREQALIPDKKRAGQHFKQFVKELEKLGYVVEYRANLVAADYGAPTSRKRFFMIARKDGMPIVWPEPTHGNPKLKAVKEGKLKPWEIAGNHIDWSIPCPSIFGRERPLAPKTMDRIFKGVERFVIEAGDNAFLVKTKPSIEAQMAAAGMKFRGDSAGAARQARAPHAPGALQVELEQMEADFILSIDHTSSNDTARGCDEPLTTTTSKARHARVGALLKHYTGVVGQDLHQPLPTITATDHNAILEAELLEASHIQRDFGNSVGQSLDEPLGTIMPGGGGKSALVASSLVKLKGTCKNGQALDEPLGTIQAQGNHYGEVRAFLTKFYSTGAIGQELAEPLHTITSKSRFGLVTIRGVDYQIVDIGMRMLEPHELYRCQGFPKDYKHRVVGGKELPKYAQVRMVGNSVPPDLARVLVAANVPRLAI